MCGINGFSFKDVGLIEKMNVATHHRGPDGTGVFFDDNITLGHNRLSIIDLRVEANQPMYSDDGNFVIVFNGEIYNFQELKKELAGDYQFKTTGDTEVLLAAYKKWGEAMFNRLNGIFAFAIWDRVKKELILARDHVGVKPLYYYYDNGKLVFSSEIKAVLEHEVPRKLDQEAFNHYLRVLYVPEPLTMFEGIKKIPPASYLKYKNGVLEIKKYWNDINVVEKKPLSKQELRDKILNSVKKQLVSDRPVGVYLSGGFDSSIILAAMKKVTDNIQTFSVGFEVEGQQYKFNQDFDLAAKTAEFFKTNHNKLIVKPDQVWEALEKAVYHLDEPISNPTIVPMIMLSQFTKQKVAVALSGDGGDELFGGYDRYRISLFQDCYQLLPKVARRFFDFIPALRKIGVEEKIDRFSLFMFQKNDVLNKVIKKQYLDLESTLRFFKNKYFGDVSGIKFTEVFMKADRKSWLVDEALMRSDKMSMANGLEVRVPLLDIDLVKLAESTTLSQKVNFFGGKVLFKKAFEKMLPKYLFKQPKRGWFSPGAKWLRYPEIYKKVKIVLSSEYYKETANLFNWEEINIILEDHVSGKHYNLTLIWSILTFQIWAKRFRITV